MAATGPTEGTDVIDIYAEEELNQVGTEDGEFVREADTSDLYDDVLTGTISNEWQRKEEEAPALQKSAPSKPDTKPNVPYMSSGQGHKRLAVYIGNFSWWTTDLDLIKAAKNVGVRDILEVRIAENRANGQSKGYAEVVVASQNSLHRLMEVLPRHKVNGTKVEVRFATRQNIGAFENRAEKRMDQKSHSQESGVDFLGSPFPIASTETVASLPYPGTMTAVHPIFNHPPFVAEMTCAIQPPGLPAAPPSRGFEAISNTPPIHLYPFVNPPPPMSVPPSGSAPSTLNFNPALFPFPSSSLTSTTTDLYVHGSSINAFSHQSDPMTPLLSEAEFEEIMNRNQAISSTAISKAVYDASTGEFREAAETLLTAIAVLRQSKVSCDVRCRVLISSLKDYLHSIESRLYGSRKHRRTQAKSYSNSLNGSRRHQERSHSDDHNEENYLGRSRDRTRQRDQRDRDRQR